MKISSQKPPAWDNHEICMFWFLRESLGNYEMKSDWFVYILRTKAGLLYTGISTDVSRRIAEHEGDVKGAKSLRGKGPLKKVWSMAVQDRSEASVIEARIKKLQRNDKEKLIKGNAKILHDIVNQGP
jgi:putative endonuclease